MNIRDFEIEYHNTIAKMKTRPDWDYPAEGHIWDEDQSVRWNREKSKLEQDRWKAEKDNLKFAKDDAEQRWLQHLINFIECEIDCSYAAAGKIWDIADWDFNKLVCLMNEYSQIRALDN